MFEKKTILITGSTSGIGYNLANYLYECGYSVVLIGRNEEKLKNLSIKLGNSYFFVCNFESDNQIKNIFNQIKDNQIKLDGFVHCAGAGCNVPIRLFHNEDMKSQMQIHYYSFCEILKYFYNKETSNDGASIVGISSMAVLTKKKGSVFYSAAKSAMGIAVSVASKEFIKRKIRVNSIMPAYVDTPMNIDLEEYVDLQKVQPMGLIPPKAISELIEFLLSDKSKFITGASIPVSAGMEG